MTLNYPNDADGEALQRVAADGNDMTAAMFIEFPVVLPDESRANQFAELAAARGFQAEIWKHDDGPGYDVVCGQNLIPEYDEIMRIQRELNEWSAPFEGFSDGWGTSGNAE